MRDIVQSFIIAFSTYSRLPMPRVEWSEKNMRYSMCWFPCVGAVIGVCHLALLYLFGTVLSMHEAVTAAVLTALPVFITGGIHMDGFLDTIDARSSYKPKEEKLKILKDPHTGAFAVIYGILYILLYFGFMRELVELRAGEHILKDNVYEVNDFTAVYLVMATAYIYVRALSGLAVVTLKKARTDGMAAETAGAADKCVKWVLCAELAACAAVMLAVHIWYGLAAVLVGLWCAVYCRHIAYKTFGGITGDIAGYFLQVCELAVLIALTVVRQIILQ